MEQECWGVGRTNPSAPLPTSHTAEAAFPWLSNSHLEKCRSKPVRARTGYQKPAEPLSLQPWRGGLLVIRRALSVLQLDARFRDICLL